MTGSFRTKFFLNGSMAFPWVHHVTVGPGLSAWVIMSEVCAILAGDTGKWAFLAQSYFPNGT